MAKETRLVAEIKRVLLLERLRNQLEHESLRDLQAVERLLEGRKGIGLPGAPQEYSDECLENVRATVRQKMTQLRSEGHRRAGAKTAIRKIIEGVVRDNEGERGITRRAAQIKNQTARFFKIYEAARKRG